MKNSNPNIKKDLFDVVKATLLELVIATVAVLIEALIVRWASMDNDAVTIFNYCVKFLAVTLGVGIGVSNPHGGLWKGAVSGAAFTALAFLMFASLDGFNNVSFSWIDLLCLTVAGGIVGAVKVNLKGRRSS